MTAFPVPKYAIGQKVFRVEVRTTAGVHDCPDCKGTRTWSCLSPAGLSLEMDCPRCQRTGGYSRHADALSLKFTRWEPYVRELTIGTIRIDTGDPETPVEYMCVETGTTSGSIYPESQLHRDHDTAQADAEAKAALRQSEHKAAPAVSECMERARLGYFDALASSIETEIAARVHERLRSQLENHDPESETTPGVWVASGSLGDGGVYHWQINAEQIGERYHRSLQICSGYGGLSDGFATVEEGPANAARIVAACNGWPRMTAAVAELAALVEESGRAHHAECSSFPADRCPGCCWEQRREEVLEMVRKLTATTTATPVA